MLLFAALNELSESSLDDNWPKKNTSLTKVTSFRIEISIDICILNESKYSKKKKQI